MSGEHFIPFRRADVVAMCADELPDAERESFVAFARMLAALLHYRFQARIEAVKDAYRPLNVDADTLLVNQVSHDRVAAQQRLEDELVALAVAANFTQMDRHEFDRALTNHSLLKVRMALDTSALDEVMFFRRGESARTRQDPTWFGLRRKTVTFTNYARVLVYARFKTAEHFAGTNVDRLPFRPGSTVIKLFQNVPREDLEMVFPTVHVRMRLVDKVLIGVPAVVSGVVVIVTKLFASLGVLLLLLAYWVGIRDKPATLNQTALLSAGAGLVAFGAYLLRQVSKFKNRKILFMKRLSESLYFRNLDNDAGVFHHLLDAAEEAEGTEAVLAYHLLRTAETPLTADELDRRVEAWLAKRADLPVDFEIDDGVRKLREFSLIATDDDERLRPVDLAEAKQRMDRVWDGVFDGSLVGEHR